ncbi:DUF4297 domain-containing protein [Muricauda sp. SCSIO 64092]|uniref:dsDNA nuclease domain-containing protein n=1 Tax=Allomuricauda sp. SCSIO 64092 TaxID=2908842 RepID=UPI001FF12796|nr:dsDNA nuclease domain-containing protein [Muricauda sp. SCSIO 64092]UOY06566.1 DUF4297 domain-containing protein [Muricauda sp. SCSIO 64092]
MSLIEKLKNVAPRENSGSISSNRFDYQKNWAICKLIELSNQEDFLLAFEFHEDIVVFNSSDNPNLIDFYQVKTKNNGKHSISSLVRKTKSGSILGKLLMNRLNFDVETNSLTIIANCDFNVKQKSGVEAKVKICCNELLDSEKEKLAESLCKELEIKWLTEYFDLIQLEKSDLTIEHHSDLTKQKLSDFIESKYADINFKPSLAYKTIFDEVKRKTNVERTMDSFDDLIKHKSISKIEFENILKIVTSEPSRITKLRDEIIGRLDSENASIQFRRYFKKNWKSVEIEYLRANNLLFKKIVRQVVNVIDENEVLLTNSLVESTNNILDEVLKAKVVEEQLIFNNDYIRIVILKEICDGE